MRIIARSKRLSFNPAMDAFLNRRNTCFPAFLQKLQVAPDQLSDELFI